MSSPDSPSSNLAKSVDFLLDNNVGGRIVKPVVNLIKAIHPNTFEDYVQQRLT